MAVSKNSLVSWWSLDQSSDGSAPVTRLDSHGSNDLTDVNTVGSAAGKVGNAGSFVAANTEFLTVADNAGLRVDDGSYTIAVQVNATSLSANPFIANKGVAGGVQEIRLDWFSGNARLTVNDGVDGATAATPIVSGAWYLIVGWLDRDSGTLNIQAEDGPVSSVDASAIGALSSASPFRIGSRGDSVGISFNGLIDEVAYWKRVLTADERTSLYNGGAGIGYDNLIGGVPMALREGFI